MDTFDEFEDGRILFEHQMSSVTSIVEDHVRLPIFGRDAAIDAPPKIFLRLAAPREYWETYRPERPIQFRQSVKQFRLIRRRNEEKMRRMKIYQLQPERQPPRSVRGKQMKTIDKTHVIRWIIRSFPQSPFNGTCRIELIATFFIHSPEWSKCYRPTTWLGLPDPPAFRSPPVCIKNIRLVHRFRREHKGSGQDGKNGNEIKFFKRTAVWALMWVQPTILAPFNGLSSLARLRRAMMPGISVFHSFHSFCGNWPCKFHWLHRWGCQCIKSEPKSVYLVQRCRFPSGRKRLGWCSARRNRRIRESSAELSRAAKLPPHRKSCPCTKLKATKIISHLNAISILSETTHMRQHIRAEENEKAKSTESNF